MDVFEALDRLRQAGEAAQRATEELVATIRRLTEEID